MKKTLVIVLAICVVIAAFAACSSNSGKQGNTNASTVENQTGDPKNLPPKEAASEVISIPINDSSVEQFEAIEIIKSYTPDELSLSQEDYDKCEFMCKNSAAEIDGDKYLEVDALIKTEIENSDGTITYSFDTKGEYFIRFDGKQIFKKDLNAKKDKYSELKIKKQKKSDKD